MKNMVDKNTDVFYFSERLSLNNVIIIGLFFNQIEQKEAAKKIWCFTIHWLCCYNYLQINKKRATDFTLGSMAMSLVKQFPRRM